ncbi:XRE family transcriptional regulator [Paraflavitalea soli]|uniref:XRE family transcriptional regulator n=2 Tax=Paraflavitalea soli TaxID=2315862 RepID=A0A3B7MJS1_9BACT|nr:XRE family transcriptional regulator [Paraflavitalea soli]
MSSQENSAIDQYAIDFVKKLMEEKEIDRQGIADILGLSRSFVRDVELGYNRAKYNLRHINALADYFGMSPREFLPEKAFPVDGVEERVVKAPVKKAAAKKAAVKKVAAKKVPAKKAGRNNR